MNKKKLCILPIALALVGACLAANSKVIGANATSEYDNPPTPGEVSADSYFTNAWEKTVGARRISERGVIVTDAAGWGYRGKIPSRKFDLQSFNFSLDLSHLAARGAMMVMIGANEGTYCIDKSNKIAIDIVKHSTDPTLYQVTVDAVAGSHAVSIADWQDGKGWQDDGAYKGRTITSEDGTIDFKIKKVNFETSIITCNDQQVNVSTEDLFQSCGESTLGYVAIGNYSGSGNYNFIINSIGDSTDEVYFSTGEFGVVRDGITELEKLDYSTISTDDLLDAKLAFDALPYSSLYSWDRNYFASRYNDLGTKISEAVAKAGNTIQLNLLEAKVDELALACQSLESEEDIDAAIAADNTVIVKIEEVNQLTLNDDEQARYAGLLGEYSPLHTQVITAVKTYYVNCVETFEAAVGTGLNSGMAYAEAMTLKGKIPAKYALYFEESEIQDLDNRVKAALDIAEASAVITHKNWVQGETGKVLTTAEETLDLVTYGECMDQTSPEDTSGLYLQQALNVLDFSVKLNFAQIPQETGHWTTIGFMQHPDMWVYSVGEVTDNQGIYFILSRISSTELQVETHLCTMSSANFFDTTLTQMLVIPTTEDVTLSFSTETREVAGVSDTYFNIKWNNIALDQENITARKIKTVIPVEGGAQKGYFFVASSGYSKYYPGVISIKDINGFSPLKEDLTKQKTEHEKPTSSTTKVTFVKGSQSGKATFNVDLHGENLVSITCDGNALSTANYTLDENKLVLNNAFCNSLTVGQHSVVLTTEGGSVTWTLDVVSNGDDPEPEPKKGGCGSSVIASSIAVAILSISGIGLVLRKKEN